MPSTLEPFFCNQHFASIAIIFALCSPDITLHIDCRGDLNFAGGRASPPLLNAPLRRCAAHSSHPCPPFAEDRARRRGRAAEHAPRGTRGCTASHPKKGHAADFCWWTTDCSTRFGARQRSDGLWREPEGSNTGQPMRERAKGHPQDGYAQERGKERNIGQGGARG